MPFSDYSNAPASNTSLSDSTFIGPNMPRDNVRPALQQIAADGRDLYDTVVAMGAGGALPAFIASGTGAVSRTALSKMREVVTPQDFGATGNGAVDMFTGAITGTDDTAAVQAAVDAALAGRRALYVPAGGYVLTDTIDIPFTLVESLSFNMRGEGNGSVFLWKGGGNKPMFQLHGTGAGAAGIETKSRLDSFRLFCNSYTGGVFTGEYTGVIGIQLGDTPEDGDSGVCNASFAGLTIQCADTCIKGYYESDEVTIFDCYFWKYSTYGVYNSHGGGNWTILSNHFYEGKATSTAIRSSLTATRVIANTIQGTQFAVAIQIDGGANEGRSPYIVGNYIECQLDHSYAIVLYGVWGGVIEGNWFGGCRGATLIALLELGGVECRNVTIGQHQHYVSGGNLNRFAYCDPSSFNCVITGHLESRSAGGTPGTFTTARIEGPFVETAQDGQRYLQGLALKDGVTAPSTVSGQAQIYVDTADGDLKVKFGDGTVKTIVVDT